MKCAPMASFLPFLNELSMALPLPFMNSPKLRPIFSSS
jgi:hypothetical protein